MSKYRSGLERKIARQLHKDGTPFKYEHTNIPFYPRPAKRRYLPDFWLRNGIIIEAKGRFRTSDRRKLKNVSARYPRLDIRLVFSRASNTISKKSSTRYSDWCDRYNFPWADNGIIPQAWLEEPPEEDRIQAIREIEKRWAARDYGEAGPAN